MIQADANDCARSVFDCKDKIKNMVQYYKKVRDEHNETGQSANFPKYYQDLDEIVGTRDCVTIPEL